ncbi:hypothetical protein C7N43_01225 [Sphingobacteriales bacterium UPWRP_1]|nr:hypothetical protein B6N25_14610 [Sphingobacteriales bacterium TSM_CSS]PSJ78931.1 hypothetical protein C7N43_01225 [Sphingobacteriales bacterium UPWRP_1]
MVKTAQLSLFTLQNHKQVKQFISRGVVLFVGQMHLSFAHVAQNKAKLYLCTLKLSIFLSVNLTYFK